MFDTKITECIGGLESAGAARLLSARKMEHPPCGEGLRTSQSRRFMITLSTPPGLKARLLGDLATSTEARKSKKKKKRKFGLTTVFLSNLAQDVVRLWMSQTNGPPTQGIQLPLRFFCRWRFRNRANTAIYSFMESISVCAALGRWVRSRVPAGGFLRNWAIAGAGERQQGPGHVDAIVSG